MTGNSSPRGSTQIERWVQHVLQALTVASIIGGFVLLSDLRTSNAVIVERLDQQGKRLDDFKAFMSDRYTGADAARDIQPILSELSDHEDRIRRLEARSDRTAR
jgi:hypothetical protein